jgi:hypothetical protein
VQEKVDGSLMIVYWYKGAWQVATKGSPDAGGNVGIFDFTFADLFWQCNPPLDKMSKYWTYSFEMTSKYNRIVCNQIDNAGTLVLLCVRELGGWEIPVSYFERDFNVVKHFNLKNFDDVFIAAKALNPLAQEGFVVTDSNFNRLKIKSPQYVLLHHMKESLSPKRMVELIFAGEQEEALAYFPELVDLHTKIDAGLTELRMKIDYFYSQYRDIVDRKTFALTVLANVPKVLTGAIFALRDGKYNCGDAYLRAQASGKIIEILKNQDLYFDGDFKLGELT